MNKSLLSLCLSAAAALVAYGPGQALAQTGNFTLELNNSRDLGSSCQLTFVATNNTGVSLTRLSYVMAMRDPNGDIFEEFVEFEFGEMPVGQSRVVLFQLDEACGDVAGLLVNEASACESDDGAHDFCRSALIATSRDRIALGT
jgi:hypothetical protein